MADKVCLLIVRKIYSGNLISRRNKLDSHGDDDEVQPTPGVREVVLESKGEPLDEHLQEENDGEDLVHVVEDFLQHGALVQVDILKGLANHTRYYTRADYKTRALFLKSTTISIVAL